MNSALESQNLEDLSEIQQLYLLYRETEARIKRRKLWTYYPDTGPLRRELYPKHMEFFRAGLRHRERLILAANRIGKSEGIGGYELTLHLTGRYPDWWEGRRFRKPITAWAAGETGKDVRDSMQLKLIGNWTEQGTGLIPGDDLVKVVPRAGVPEAADKIYVKHVSGGNSVLALKSYEQGRESFQSTEIDVIWLDEECPENIYSECIIRTMTTGGIIMLTFTPLNGLTPLIMQFLPGGQLPAQDAA